MLPTHHPQSDPGPGALKSRDSTTWQQIVHATTVGAGGLVAAVAAQEWPFVKGRGSELTQSVVLSCRCAAAGFVASAFNKSLRMLSPLPLVQGVLALAAVPGTGDGN